MVSLVNQGTPSSPGKSGTMAAEPAAITQRRKPRRRPPASIASGRRKCAEASTTSTPMPRKRAAELFGAMRAMAPWTCARTPAQSTSGGGRRRPKRAAPRASAAAWAAASSALEGTQP